jgi:hypothetical protein
VRFPDTTARRQTVSETNARRRQLTHFCLDVLKGRRADEREANQEDIRLRVRQRSETVVVFLPGCVPQAEGDRLAVDHDISGVVVEH